MKLALIFDKFRKGFFFLLYQLIAVLILFVAVNIFYQFYKKFDAEKNTALSSEIAIESDWNASEHFAILNSLKQRFKPFVHWISPSVKSTTSNIDENGIRYTWLPPDIEDVQEDSILTIFVFGGSTCWGYGAPDEGTIPSWIAKKMYDKEQIYVRVFNLGAL